MPRAKRTKKFAQMKRMISLNDPRLKDKVSTSQFRLEEVQWLVWSWLSHS